MLRRRVASKDNGPWQIELTINEFMTDSVKKYLLQFNNNDIRTAFTKGFIISDIDFEVVSVNLGF